MIRVTIDNIISSYNKAINSRETQNVELEAKIHDVSLDKFIDSMERISKKTSMVSVETTVNVLTNKTDQSGNYAFVETMIYENNARVGQTYGIKKNIGAKFQSSNEFMKYALSLSLESPASKESVSNTFNSITRFKTRASFVFPENDSWRYDYTVVSSLQASELNGTLIKQKRDLMFSGIRAGMPFASLRDKIIEIAQDKSVHFEIEVERVSQTEIKGSREIEDALGLLWQTIDPSYTENDPKIKILREIYDLISGSVGQKKLTLKNILNAAKSLTKNDYYQGIYPPIGYFVTDKADGSRAVLYISNGMLHVLTGTELISEKIAGQSVKCLADCELIKTKTGKTLLGIFDVMNFNDKSVVSGTLEERIQWAPKIVTVSEGTLKGLGITVFVKEYKQIVQPIEEAILYMNNVRREYKTDGLILTSQTGSYYETKNYKWKPTEENTIDFMVIDCPESFLGKKEIPVREDKRAYCLLSGMNMIRRRQLGVHLWPSYQKDTGVDPNGPYIPVLFQSTLWPLSYIYYGPKDSDLSGKICEFAVSLEARESLSKASSSRRIPENIWDLTKIRDDRNPKFGEYGNDYDIAEGIFSSIIDPFELKDLWTGLSGYFEKTRDEIYRAPNKMKRYVIDQAFKKYIQPGNTVLDMAAGRGADLGLYFGRGVSHLVAVDIDPNALVELVRRSMDPELNKKKHSKGAKVSVLVADIGDEPAINYGAIQDRFSVRSADVIVCNFAFHYLCQNARTCSNAFSLARDMASVERDTMFMMTVLDGRRVFEILKDIPKGQSWTVRQENVDKYLIRKDYSSDSLEDFGQMISVKLPMTSKLYPEPLCNITAVVKVASQFSFELISNEPFSEFMKGFAANVPHIYKNMTKEDIEYCGLHNLLVFRHIPKAQKSGSYSSYQRRRGDLRNDFLK